MQPSPARQEEVGQGGSYQAFEPFQMSRIEA